MLLENKKDFVYRARDQVFLPSLGTVAKVFGSRTNVGLGSGGTIPPTPLPPRPRHPASNNPPTFAGDVHLGAGCLITTPHNENPIPLASGLYSFTWYQADIALHIWSHPGISFSFTLAVGFPLSPLGLPDL